MIAEIGQYYEGYKKQKFIMAMLLLFKDEQFTFKKFIKKLSLNRNKLYHCVNTLDYVDAIERLYNWGSSNKVKFRR
jgi:predicted AAA+ superfamily ATPase